MVCNESLPHQVNLMEISVNVSAMHGCLTDVLALFQRQTDNPEMSPSAGLECRFASAGEVDIETF